MFFPSKLGKLEALNNAAVQGRRGGGVAGTKVNKNKTVVAEKGEKNPATRKT